MAAGKRLRGAVPRASLKEWRSAKDRPDPLALLAAADPERLPELVPVRYGRMLPSPFTFFRGAAAVMAADLAPQPVTGIRVQACGDCHLMNFGGFATPERNIIFDINDFDETLPGPWEWDIKRLVVSLLLAARTSGWSDDTGKDASVACARSYRKHMRDLAEMNPLERWYARIDSEDYINLQPHADRRAKIRRKIERESMQSGSELDYPRLTEVVGGEVHIHDAPPLISHPEQTRAPHFHDEVIATLAIYRETLPEERRTLLDHYRFVDSAIKVVGIGSVGRRCWIALLMSSSNHPLFLQFKEAAASVLERYAGASAHPHHGQRVVVGQRLMQPASDIFLGWVTGPRGLQYHVRQLRDAKIKPLIETLDPVELKAFGKTCGWALARAHAKVGDAWAISGYLGTGTRFDDALGSFALAYADQVERDHQALLAAVKAGRITVERED
jgi:uncharacterized protein (DUF2252 family)